MFTGLIREVAKVRSFENSLLTIESKYSPKIGDSIAINGACLTVVSINNNLFSVELSPESEEYLVLSSYQTGKDVHIEPAMQMGDRFEGHIVQGHIDTVGEILEINNNGNSFDYTVSIENKFQKFLVPKGSVTIDGVSLTINDIYDKSFRLTIIPHTVENTLFREYKIGSKVNIETDMFARYIYHIFKKDKYLSWDEIDSISLSY
jgi:riboflavin synthase